MTRFVHTRFRLATLVGVVLLAGLSFGLARAWALRTSEEPSASGRIVAEILASRADGERTNAAPRGDPTLFVGLVAAALLGPAILRKARRPLHANS